MFMLAIRQNDIYTRPLLRHPPFGRTAQERTSALRSPEVPHSPLPAVETSAELRLNVKPKTPKMKKKFACGASFFHFLRFGLRRALV